MQGAKKRDVLNQLLGNGIMTSKAEAAIGDLLKPGLNGDTWPDIELLLFLAKHEVVRTALYEGQLSEELVSLLSDSLTAIAPLINQRFLGPLEHRLERFVECYSTEENIYDRVYRRLQGDIGDTERLRIISAYMDTRAVPLFIARFRQIYPELTQRAQEKSLSGKDLRDVFLEDSRLIDRLQFEQEQADASATIIASATALSTRYPTLEISVERALKSSDETMRLVAGALAVYFGRIDDAAQLLHYVIVGDKYAAQYCVFASLLDAEMTCHILSQFLVDAAWANPEEPENQLTPDKVNAMVAARWILPRVGSPLQAIASDAFPEYEIVQKMARCWQTMTEVNAQKG